MLEFILNGEPYQADVENLTVADLVKQMKLEKKRFAIEINEEIVTRSEYPQFQIQPQDHVEIVQAIGGG